MWMGREAGWVTKWVWSGAHGKGGLTQGVTGKRGRLGGARREFGERCGREERRGG